MTAPGDPPGDRADLHQWLSRDEGRPGKHRAIPQHPFVPHPRGEDFGCGLIEVEEGQPDMRCGYYRRYHPTMLIGWPQIQEEDSR